MGWAAPGLAQAVSDPLLGGRLVLMPRRVRFYYAYCREEGVDEDHYSDREQANMVPRATEQFSLHKGTIMRNFRTLIAATSVALSSAMAAYAQNQNPLPLATDVLVRYGDDVEGWTVFANQTRGGCLIVRTDGPNAVQMGVTANQEVGYLGVFTKADIGLQNGGTSDIFVSIANHLYKGVATSTTSGELKGGYSGGYILTDDPNFKRDVAKQYEMIVFPETTGTFVVDLKGTFKAMAAGRKCLKQ